MLTAHQRIRLRRAGIRVEHWSGNTLLFRSERVGRDIEIRKIGLWDDDSGIGPVEDVGQLRRAVRDIVTLHSWFSHC